MHLPFAEWLALERRSHSALYDKLYSRYSKSPPLFWEKTFTADSGLVLNRTPENARLLMGLVERELETLVKALHWYTGTAPIHPMRSVTYFDPRSEENFGLYSHLDSVISELGVQRGYGESEKEYATQNENPTIFLRQIDAVPLAGMVAFARQTQDVWMGEQYELASQSLSLCSAPGLDWPSRILLLVGAYESLILPDRTTDLQKGFERRFSCMVAEKFEDVSEYVRWLRSAYQFRSDMIHGRPLSRTLKKIQISPQAYVAIVSQMGVLALCKLIRYRHAHPEVEARSDPLWAVLDSAYLETDGFAALQALISSALAARVSHQWQMEDSPC
ncbi:MAG: hypothetical protein ACREXS_19485 [Gammaproteobacteria bacterium]